MSTDQAYVDGAEAFTLGNAPSANPFSPLSQPALFDAWHQGWLDARVPGC